MKNNESFGHYEGHLESFSNCNKESKEKFSNSPNMMMGMNNNESFTANINNRSRTSY
jgi:hypothetical protein